MGIFRSRLRIWVTVIEGPEYKENLAISTNESEMELTPAGITHSSLYDNVVSGEIKGSRAVSAVVIRSDSFTIATLFPQKPRICQSSP